MSSYLMKNYKDRYNLMAEVDKRTNDFCRDKDGNLDNYSDIWIECQGKCRVYHFGSNVLQFYSPSIIRGRNILNKLNEYRNVIFDIEETDKELLFKFKAKDFEKLAPCIQPKDNHAGRSCFSVKNLRHQLGIKTPKKCDIAPEILAEYQSITSQIGKENISVYNKINDGFLTELGIKNKCSLDTFKERIKTKNITTRCFIYGFGEQVWNEYLNYINNYIKENL